MEKGAPAAAADDLAAGSALAGSFRERHLCAPPDARADVIAAVRRPIARIA